MLKSSTGACSELFRPVARRCVRYMDTTSVVAMIAPSTATSTTFKTAYHPRRIEVLTMRLSDAGLHQRQTKALYPNHRLPPWLNEDAPRDRSNRLLGDAA
jgi:hypothetical protein